MTTKSGIRRLIMATLTVGFVSSCSADDPELQDEPSQTPKAHSDRQKSLGYSPLDAMTSPEKAPPQEATMLAHNIYQLGSMDTPVTDLETFGARCLFEQQNLHCATNHYGCMNIYYFAARHDEMRTGQPHLRLESTNSDPSDLRSCYRRNFDVRNCTILFKRHCPQTFADHLRVWLLDDYQLQRSKRWLGSDELVE